jgi:hypothetical protein
MLKSHSAPAMHTLQASRPEMLASYRKSCTSMDRKKQALTQRWSSLLGDDSLGPQFTRGTLIANFLEESSTTDQILHDFTDPPDLFAQPLRKISSLESLYEFRSTSWKDRLETSSSSTVCPHDEEFMQPPPAPPLEAHGTHLILPHNAPKSGSEKEYLRNLQQSLKDGCPEPRNPLKGLPSSTNLGVPEFLLRKKTLISGFPSDASLAPVGGRISRTSMNSQSHSQLYGPTPLVGGEEECPYNHLEKRECCLTM